MPEDIRVIQCLVCRTYQCETIRKDSNFSCKLCGSSQSVGKEVFRGSGRECRINCMKLNNQRMESDQSFIDMMPQDIMNESYKSDFDSSFLSNRSKSVSPLSRTLPLHITTEDEDPSTSSSVLSESMDDDYKNFGSGNSSQCSSNSPGDRDTKRKLNMAVTPQKDLREHKRPRPSNPFTTIQQPQNNNQNQDSKVMPKSTIRNTRFDKNIQAQWKYQHLMNTEAITDENSLITKFSTNSFKPSTTTASLWNAFVDSEMRE